MSPLSSGFTGANCVPDVGLTQSLSNAPQEAESQIVVSTKPRGEVYGYSVERGNGQTHQPGSGAQEHATFPRNAAGQYISLEDVILVFLIAQVMANNKTKDDIPTPNEKIRKAAHHVAEYFKSINFTGALLA
ncbi:hypothetical protein G7Y89_g12108 [Cudoniella acicularis]|uniref:Uncharacterized protein n=1 Tax=Cudoniella acicularis TaxID=354080 RepID=A0A8H4VZZ6_9HELO|nr:hypothetical protein G7Y89_g12108 [Cudoniella acicularis]